MPRWTGSSIASASSSPGSCAATTARMADATLERFAGALRDADLQERRGRVTDLIGLVIEATGLRAQVGELCQIETSRTREPVPAEVVGFRAARTLLMPLGEVAGIGPGNRVSASGGPF